MSSSVGAHRPHTARAWLVDLDGTLYHGPLLQLAMGLEVLLCGPRHIALLRRFRHEHEALRHDVPDATRSPFSRQVERTAAGLGCSTAEVEAVVREWTQRRPGKWIRLFRRRAVLRAIAAFRATGGVTAVVSDYPATGKLAAMQASHLFDVVVANGEETSPSALKPHPSGYLRAATLLGVPPEACLVIGDRADADGAAATAAQMSFHDVRRPLRAPLAAPSPAHP